MPIRSRNPFAPNAGIDTSRDSARRTRPPTYISNVTAVPTYTSNEPNPSSANGHNERVSARRTSLHSASSVAFPDFDTMLEQYESSLTDTAIVVGTSSEIPRPGGTRYRELEFA